MHATRRAPAGLVHRPCRKYAIRHVDVRKQLIDITFGRVQAARSRFPLSFVNGNWNYEFSRQNEKARRSDENLLGNNSGREKEVNRVREKCSFACCECRSPIFALVPTRGEMGVGNFWEMSARWFISIAHEAKLQWITETLKTFWRYVRYFWAMVENQLDTLST